MPTVQPRTTNRVTVRTGVADPARSTGPPATTASQARASSGSDVIEGGDGVDFIWGEGDDTLRGGDGDDAIKMLGPGSATIDGGDGNDSIGSVKADRRSRSTVAQAATGSPAAASPTASSVGRARTRS
jgi:hypothetical protein